MTLHIDDVLLAFQFGDSTFPSGAFTFSWGLEGLIDDGLVETKQDVIEIVEQQLFHRWRCADRVLLTRAHTAIDEAELLQADALAEASASSAAMRAGTRRAGRRLLTVCAQLGFPRTLAYRQRVLRSPELGHLPVVQGLVLKEAGLTLATAELVSGWSVVSGLTAAAVRLGVIGHIDAQAAVGRLRTVLKQILIEPADAAAMPSSFTPLMDIALGKSADRHRRIFSN